MKYIVFILLFNISSANSFAHSPCVMFIPKYNSISFNILGTGTYIGFSYERLVGQRLGLEIGAGLLGVGAGVSYYPLSIRITGGLSPYTGLKTTFNSRGSGDKKNVTYIPFGITYFTRNSFAFGIDVGPSYQTNYTPIGKVTAEHAATFPNSEFSIYGNLKLSYRF